MKAPAAANNKELTITEEEEQMNGETEQEYALKQQNVLMNAPPSFS